MLFLNHFECSKTQCNQLLDFRSKAFSVPTTRGSNKEIFTSFKKASQTQLPQEEYITHIFLN